MREWYVILKAGSHPAPARGPHRSLDEAQEAWNRFFERYGGMAGSYIAAGSVRIAGPFRTRREAAAADISIPHPYVTDKQIHELYEKQAGSMEYKITFLNDNAERTITERGLNALESAQNDLETLLDAENHETEELGNLYDYAFDPITDDEGSVQYFCYLLSAGLPGTVVRFYPHRTEFVYLDWFSGIGFDVSSDKVFQRLRECLAESGLLNFQGWW